MTFTMPSTNEETLAQFRAAVAFLDRLKVSNKRLEDDLFYIQNKVKKHMKIIPCTTEDVKPMVGAATTAATTAETTAETTTETPEETTPGPTANRKRKLFGP